MKLTRAQKYLEDNASTLIWVLMFLWTVLMGASLVWNLHQVREFVLELAQNEANLSFEKDLAYRLWAAKHGGVYVPVTSQSPPSPYLTHVPEREIKTPAGRILTLINPAYMTRQVHQLTAELYGSRGHLTSLKPLRPENAPDAWETEALKAFEGGKSEVIEQVILQNKPYLRLMRPWRTEQACLKCHADQGYKVGDIRGGISVTVPLQPYLAGIRSQTIHLLAGHGLIWLLGLVGIFSGGRRLQKHLRQRRQTEAELAETLRQKEEALAQLERLASFPKLNPNPVLEIDAANDIIYANQAALEVVQQLGPGVSLQDFLPRDWQQILESYQKDGAKNPDYEVRLKDRVFSESIAFVEQFNVWRVYYRDVTARKQAEEALKASLRFLEVVQDHTETKTLLEAFLSEIKTLTGCEAVGIRVLGENGNIPYLAYQGFSRHFYELESPLNIQTDKCMCINVIRGTTDPRLPFYTTGGSFYMNGTSRFLATVSEDVKGSSRNMCNQMGYESVALIPFRRGDQVLGLIHVADSRENMVPRARVEILEKAGIQLGAAYQRLETEAELRESEARFRSLFQNMTEGVVMHELIYGGNGQVLDYRILSANPAFEHHTGLAVAAIQGKTGSQAYGTSEPPYLDVFARVAQTGEPNMFETYFPPLQRYFHISVTSPKPDQFVTVFEDITARRQMEQTLRRSHQRLDLLAESAGQLLVSVAPQKVVDTICPKVMEFLECEVFFNFLLDDQSNRLHLNAYAGIPADEARRIEWLEYGVAVCGCAARDGCRIVAENIQTTLDSRTDLVKSYGIQAYACHPLMIQGVVLGTLSFGTRRRSQFTADELTLMKAVADQVAIAIDRKQAEEKLRQHSVELSRLVEDLERQNAELERFAYMISHDLKSPLVTISTFLGYLEKDMAAGDTAQVRKDMGYMQAAADKMGRLLSELLEMSRVGRVANQPVSVTFQELVQEALEAVAGSISGRGLEVSLPEDDLTLFGDRPRLVEIWQNLIENAVKFLGEQPSPELRIGLAGEGKETIFFVCDNGIGIEPKYQSKIFAIFEKLDIGTEGTGIGLALVKRIVELYHGSIWVESAGPGQGACFRFTLPEAIPFDEHNNN